MISGQGMAICLKTKETNIALIELLSLTEYSCLNKQLITVKTCDFIIGLHFKCYKEKWGGLCLHWHTAVCFWTVSEYTKKCSQQTNFTCS